MDGNDKILAKDLISINRVSLLLTGNEFTLRWDRGFGKHKSSVERLLSEVQDWIDSDKNKDDTIITRITASPNISKEFAGVKIFKDDILPAKGFKGFESVIMPNEYNRTGDVGAVDWKSFGTAITSLPKERKMIVDGNLKGLYSAGNKWYTNKIVDNALVILEWDKLDYAKKYLESLIK